MLIDIDHGFAFFCNRKCASHSIHKALEPHASIVMSNKSPDLYHINYRDYDKYILPVVRLNSNVDIETVAIIREPVDRVMSIYRYRKRGGIQNPNSPLYKYSTHNISFEEFVDAACSSNPPPFAKLMPQHEFVMDKSGSVKIDRLFKFDKIDCFVSYIDSKMGLTIDLEQLNESQYPMWKIDYKARHKLEKLLLRDLEIYESI